MSRANFFVEENNSKIARRVRKPRRVTYNPKSALSLERRKDLPLPIETKENKGKFGCPSGERD